ncbi:MAG: copper transporter, partial [Nocardioides sp.]|nr:copper transporter [Nocardioides sp.]
QATDRLTGETTPPPAAGDGGATTHQSAGELAEAGGARFLTDNRAGLLSGRLTGHSVAILAMPGAPAATIKGVQADITAAGGSTSRVLQAQAQLLDPTRRQYVDTLATQLGKQLTDRPTTVAAGVDSYQRIGQVIGATYAGKSAVKSFDEPAKTAAVALQDGGLVTAQGKPGAPADQVVVLLGPDQDAAAVKGIVQGLGATTRGVVAAGSSSSKDLQAVRAQSLPGWLVTVDGADNATGQLATTLAVPKAAAGDGGSFGASGFTGLLAR